MKRVKLVSLVHDGPLVEDDQVSISSPEDAFEHLRDICTADREHFVCLHLDARNRVVSRETVSIGALNSALVHPREIFKGAILSNAASIIMAHTHPSNDATPSREDIDLNVRLRQAGELMGIEVVDHLIITPGGRFLSFKKANLM